MDIIGALGYAGQKLHNLTTEKLTFSNGTGLVVVSETGPVEMIPRLGDGASALDSHLGTQNLVIAPHIDGHPVELLDINTRELKMKLPNPTQGKIVDLSFSHDGERIIGLSDVADHQVIMWDTASGKIVFAQGLPVCFQSCSINPGDSTVFALYGDEGVHLGYVTEIMGESSVRFEKLELYIETKKEEESEELDEDTEADEITAIAQSNCIGFITWAPNNVIYVGTGQGAILYCNIITRTVKVIAWTSDYPADGDMGPLGLNVATCALITANALIVGTSGGNVMWFAMKKLLELFANNNVKPGVVAPADTPVVTTHKPSEVVLPSSLEYSIIKASQLARITRYGEPSNSISTMLLDANYTHIHVGCKCGAIYKFGVDVVSVAQEGEGDEDQSHHDEESQEGKEEEMVELEAEPCCNFHEGAVLCSSSLCLPVVRMDDGVATRGYSTTMSIFITGSHLGTVTCWQAPPAAGEFTAISKVEPRADNKTIRHALPYLLKVMNRTKVESSNYDASVELNASVVGEATMSRVTTGVTGTTPAVTVLEILSSAASTGGRLLAVGTSDGCVEIWWLQAFESDEEDGDDVGDEEGQSFKLVITKVMRRHLFHAPISIIKASTTWPCFNVGALNSRTQYIFSTANIVYFDVVARVMIPKVVLDLEGNVQTLEDADLTDDAIIEENEFQPLSSLWKDDSLWIICRNGFVLMYAGLVDGRILNSKFRYDAQPKAPTSFWNSQTWDLSSFISSVDGNIIVFGGLDHPSVHCFSGLPTTTPRAEEGAIMVPEDLTQIPTACLFEDDLHEFSDVVLCGCVSLNGSLLVLGTADGVIHNYKIVRSAESDEVKYEPYHRVQLHRSAILSLVFSVDSSLVLSCAADGTAFVYILDQIHVPRTDPVPQLKIKVEDSDLQRLINVQRESFNPNWDGQLWLDVRRNEAEVALQESYTSKCDEIVKNIGGISKQLRELLNNNDNAAEIDKMELEEFVVDLNGKNALLQKNEEMVQSVREEYNKKNLINELVAARIRQDCWDSMEIRSVALLPIHDESLRGVSSFAVKSYSDAEHSMLNKTRVLRAVEIRSQKLQMGGKIQYVNSTNARAVWNTSIAGIPAEVSWVAFDGEKWPVDDVVTMILTREQAEIDAANAVKGGKTDAPEETNNNPPPIATMVDDDDEYGEGQTREFDDTNIFNLLYPPMAVRTHVQKRMQIVFMKEIARLMRTKFNEHFEKLLREKDDVMGSIEARNMRITEVLNELHITDDFPVNPVWSDEELAGSAVTVRDNEITARPYENEKAREKRLKEEEDRRKAMEADKDDIKGRALEDMMYGTLEVKRDVLADATSLHRPKWMDEIAIENMSEMQRKEYDEFEAKAKSFAEEQAKYRKSLEQEVKRLRAENSDAMKQFDDKVGWLTRLKMLTQRELFAVELYICRLSLSMSKTEQAKRKIRRIEEDIEDNRHQRAKLREKLDIFSVQVNQMHSHMVQLQEECNAMDKGFKRDIQTLCNTTFDQDALKQLTWLYRRRDYREDLSRLEDGEDDGGDDPNGGDDFLDVSGGRSKKQSSRMGSKRGGQSMKASIRASKARKSARNSGAQSHASGAKSQRGSGGHMGHMQAALVAMKDDESNAHKHDDSHAFNEHDPFYVVLMQKLRLKRIQEAQIPLLTTLSMELDCPENLNVDQFAWSKLQDLRTARIQKEIELKNVTRNYGEMKAKLDDMTAQDTALVSEITTLRTSRDETTRSLDGLNNDIEILVTLKQGQDEVDKDAVVTDYSDALLVPVNVVNRYNARILELGKEKISVLSKIKHFRRKINLVDWEATHMQLEAHHLEEYYTDLQLFRVTREMQQVIRGGINNADQIRVRQMYINHYFVFTLEFICIFIYYFLCFLCRSASNVYKLVKNSWPKIPKRSCIN